MAAIAGPWTTDDLLTECKLTPYWSDSDGPLTDAEILRIANSEMQSHVFPLVLNASKGAWRSYDFDQSITADQQYYRLPPRSHGSRLYDVVYVNSNSDESSIPVLKESESAEYYNRSTGRGPDRFYIKDGSVWLLPTPNSTTGTLRLKYPMRPGKLVATSAGSTPAAAKITTIGAAASGGGTERTFTFDTVPTAWTDGDLMDVVRGDGAFETSALDMTSADISTGASGTVDVEEADFTVADIAVGDYFCLAGESCIPQIPDVAHPYLVARVKVQMAIVNRDRDGYNMEKDVAAAMRAELEEMLGERVEGEPDIVVPNFSPVRQISGAGRSWR